MTLIELLVGSALLLFGLVMSLGAITWQAKLEEHSRNLSWASNDATRVMEQLRNQHAACAQPSAAPPLDPPPPAATFASWDAWLADTGVNGGGGKTIQPDPANNELVVVTCRTEDDANLCADVVDPDPIAVTVAICWRHQERILGECVAAGPALAAAPALNPGGNDNVTESLAMLSTLLTCQ